MPLPTTPYLHGKDGSVEVAGDGDTFVELDATEWSGNPFAVDEHVFGTFTSAGAKRAVGGLSGGQFTITVKGRSDQDIRAADRNLIENQIMPFKLYEPGYAVPHSGNALVRSVEPRVVANAEMEYRLQCTSDGAWTRGTQEEPAP